MQIVDNENGTENTLLKNMLQIENKYETPIDPNNYQKTNNSQNQSIHTPQVVKNSSGVNSLHQIRLQKSQPPKEKYLDSSLLLERPKSKNFQSSDLEIDFLIDSGAESNSLNFTAWNQIQILHAKISPSKTSCNLATAQW